MKHQRKYRLKNISVHWNPRRIYPNSAAGGYSVLVHIAGIGKSVSLVRSALSAGVRRFILVHTTGIYSKYKAAGETYRQIDAEVRKMCSDAGASLTILRPTMIYGDLNDSNVATFISMVDRLRIFPVVDKGKFALQPVWCGDLGKAYFDVLMNREATDNKDYVLSGGKPIDLIDMLKEIGRQLNVVNKFVSVPFPIAYSGAWILYLLSFTKLDLREQVQRLVEPRAYEHFDASNDFGYEPSDFETGVKSEIEAYKAKNKRTRGHRERSANRTEKHTGS